MSDNDKIPDAPAKPTGQVNYKWARQRVPNKNGNRAYEPRIVWSLSNAANGQVLASSNQGSRDITDARKTVQAAASAFGASSLGSLKEVGPGPKPKT